MRPRDNHGTFEWEYDAEAGDGVVFRYDEATGKLVGVTIVGVRARLVSGSAGR